MDCATDAIDRFQRRTGSGKAGVSTGELDHQTFGIAALQSQATECVVVIDSDFTRDDVHNVRVVPHAFGCQFRTADQHRIGRITRQTVQPDHRPVVIGKLTEDIGGTCGPA